MTSGKSCSITFLLLSLWIAALAAEAGPLTRIAILPTGDNLWCAPTLADLDGDGNTLEVVVGDQNGVIWAYRSNLTLMWSYSIRSFPQAENKTVNSPAQASPAVADIDNDGKMEVVVALGNRDRRDQPGRLFVIHLDANGMNPQPGFYLVPMDRVEGADGVADAIYASPALADLNNDGTLEIVVGSFDHCLYCLDWRGIPQWNLSYSDLFDPETFYYSGDTIWATPALADIDNDSFIDIFFVNPNVGDRLGYKEIGHSALNGGALVALNANGTIKFGSFMYEHYATEWIYHNSPDHLCRVNPSVELESSPIIADVDADGKLELVMGTGLYYGPPFTDDRHNRIFCYNVEDDTPITTATLPGVRKTPRWSVDLGKDIYMSPAVANLDNDPDLEVVIRTIEETNPQVFVIKGSTGTMLPGFPKPLQPNTIGRPLGCAIADIDGDGRNDILMPSWRDLFIYGDDGKLKDKFGFDVPPEQWDTHFVDAEFLCSPAVADVDNDGYVEVFFSSHKGLYVFRGGRAGPIAWGQYRQNSRKTGYLPINGSIAVKAQGPAAVAASQSFQITVSFRNDGSATWLAPDFWIVSTRGGLQPSTVPLPPGKRVRTGERVDVQFVQQAPSSPGTYVLGWKMVRVGVGRFGAELTFAFTCVEAPARSDRRWRAYQ
ncbi:VCBS repeat-containing protein [Candidatus Sumerlaeota bacterium]|nr:VCBS repeat-containing protein [Candidatus Sumerlaeota bacterium]